MNNSRNVHRGKSPTDKQNYKSRLKEPKAAELTLPADEDSFTMPPSQNEKNVKKEEKVEHRPYRRTKRKTKVDFNLTKLILEIAAAIILAIITLLTVTLNREVGEHGVKIETIKEDVANIENKVDKCIDKIDNVKDKIVNQPMKTP